MDQLKIRQIIDLFSKGFTLDKAIETISPQAISSTRFLDLVEENSLGDYWLSRRKIRELVVGTLEEVSNDLLAEPINSATPISWNPKEKSSLEVSSAIDREISLLKGSAETFWKIGVIHQKYLQSSSEIDEVCIAENLKPSTYYYFLSLHKTLKESHDRALEIKKQIYLPQLEAQKLQLMKNLMTQLVDQTTPDNYNVIDTLIENQEKVFFDADGKEAGKSKSNIDRTKIRQMKVPANVLKMAAELLMNTTQSKVVPEGVIKLDTISRAELERRKKDIRAKIEELKKKTNG